MSNSGDLAAGRRRRQLPHRDVEIGYVDQRARFLDEEMVVRGRIGVEIGARAFDRDFAQQPGVGELVQRVVDRRQRHRQLGRPRLLEQHFGGQVAVAAAEQQPAQRDALPGRSETRLAQFAAQRVDGTGAHGAAAAGD